MSRRPSKRWRLLSFSGLSLIAHACLLLFLAASGLGKGCERLPGLPRGSSDPIEVTTLDLSQLPAADLDRFLRETPEQQARREREESDPHARGQVVELPRPAEERRPERADYLSEHDSSVEKQTQSRRRGEGAPEPRPALTASPMQPPRLPVALAMRETARRGGRQPLATAGERNLASTAERLAGGELPAPGAGATGVERGAAGAEERGDQVSGGAPGARPLPSLADLMPSDEQLGRAIGAPVRDYLKDVDEGDSTALNSKRWRFASFFNRVKRAVAERWHPDVEYRQRDPNGNIYGFRDRLTILRVRLDAGGSLKDVALEKASGLDFLDDQAIAAFRQAQPFPNPPRGLVDERGEIGFRFGFLFEISSSPTIKLFRYQ